MENSRNIRSFLLGLTLGIFVMATGIAAYTVYEQNVRWSGITPNNKIREIYSLLSRNSIMDFDFNEMLENMYRGLLDGVGDPYTQYFCPEALAAFHVRMDGVFVGIGVMVYLDPDDRMTTISVTFQGAPAAEAGLLPGDKIVAVDGIDVVGRPREEVIGMVQGPENTVVRLTILRPDENRRFDADVMRARVEVPTVFHEMMYSGDDAIGYIRIEAFDRVTLPQFTLAIQELYEENMNGLIIDLRNNPGGSLDVVNRITDMLIPEGVITFTVDALENRTYYRSNAYYLGLPLVLLVNGRSASASEVLSGAVRDTNMGTLVGTQTYGKGIVQMLFHLSDQTAIKTTVSTYFTPAGESIHGVGITPDVIVEMDEDLSRRIGNLPLYEDIQLQTAIRIAANKINQR